MFNILIVKTHAIGDLLMATPAIRELRKAYPDATISILVGKWSAPCLRNNPYVDNILDFDDDIFFKKKFTKIVSLISSIRKKRFDTTFIFHPSPLIHFITLLAGIKKRIGLRRNKRGVFLTDYIDENTSNSYYYPLNFLKLLSTLGIDSQDTSLDIFYNDRDRRKMDSLFDSMGITNPNKLIVIGAGGSHNPKEKVTARLWPKEYFVELIKKINVHYPDYSVLLCGSENDALVNRYIENNTTNVKNITGKTSITELAYTIQKSKIVICNDSAFLHMAIAKKIPFICMFGPTSLKARVPESQSKYCIQSSVDCSPCYKYAIFPGCSYKVKCMNSINPDHVFTMFSKIIRENYRK